MDTLVKPQKQYKEYYDYLSCADYLERKYGHIERDLKKGQDFWIWLIDHESVRRDQFLALHRERWLEIQEDWAKVIYGRYLDEFADESGRAVFFVTW